MKLNKALVSTLVAFSFCAAYAVPVTEMQVKLAAKGWSSRGGTLGSAIGRTVEKVSMHTTTNGAAFYAVKMSGGGTLFMSSDTDYTPVIAFTSSGVDYSSLDRNSPLWALLNRDVSALKSAAETSAQASPANSTTASSAAVSTASVSKLWDELIEEGGAESDDNSAPNYASPITSGNPGDLRAGPILKSKWSQSTSKGKACWNYYTPNGSNPSKFVEGDVNNAVCGCVATAMAQVMRYHSYPEASLGQLTRGCFWNEAPVKLTTKGGTYDWAKMPLVPAAEDNLTDEKRQAIGKLASDAGISVYMQYSKDSSGAFAFDISGALKDYWRYGSAVYFNSDKFSEADLAAVSRKVLYSNFDAGLPVLMGIPGHQIVADGYGWNSDLEYVHLNMGWADQHDVWYNLPEMQSAHPGFNSVDDFVYNVVPDGDADSAVISGRTLDDDGKPLSGCSVKLYRAGELVAEDITSDHGVWGVVVKAGTYQVSAHYEDNSLLIGEIESVTVGKPAPVDIKWNSLRTVPTVQSIADAGNSWGNDIVMRNPSVRVGGNVYGSLEKALDAARELSVPLVEILSATELRKSVTVDFDCVIASVAANPADASVLRRENASLTVAEGGSLTFSNVVFAAEEEIAVVNVLTGGKLSVGNGVSFGLPATVAAVVTADAAGFEISGPVTESFGIDCAAARTAGDVFGYATCDYLTASNSAVRIVDVNDVNGEISGFADPGAGTPPFELKWALQPVPYEDSVAYFVDGEGVTNCFRRFDRLFEIMGMGGTVKEIVLRESGSITVGAVLPQGEFTIRGESGNVELDTALDAGFVIGQGTTATISGVTFDGFKGNALFLVDGGDLRLENGTSISDAVATNYHSAAVAVLDGSLSVGPGVKFSGCRTEATGENGRGGAIYVGKGGELEMNGGVITGCHASYYGGGIYADEGVDIRMSGVLAVSGNTSGKDKVKADDVYLHHKGAALTVCGRFTGEVGTASYGKNKEGVAFAFAGEGVDKAVMLTAAKCFFNNVDTGLVAGASDDGKSLVWNADDGVVDECAEADAAVRVSLKSDPGVYRYYAYVDDAFKTIAADSLVELMKDGVLFRDDIVVTNDVVFSSVPGVRMMLMRSGDVSVSVASDASLELGNIAMSGSLIDFASGYTLDVDRSVPFIDVSGALTFADGASVTNTSVSVSGCAALTVRDGGVAYLSGGEITGCEGVSAGGVYIESGGSARVSGDVRVTGNFMADGSSGDVVSESVFGIVLAGDFTGSVGVASPAEDVFGRVSSTYLGTAGGDWTAVTNGAAMFVNGIDLSTGVVATNSADAAADVLMVWRSSLDQDGNYTDSDGNVYIGIIDDDGEEEGAEPTPIAFKSIAYADGVYSLTVTGAVARCWYYLYSDDSLADGFTVDVSVDVPSATTNATEDGELIFNVPAVGDRLFWKVLAYPELEPLE